MLSPRPRPRRVSVDRSSRDGDGQTVGSRLVKGGTARAAGARHSLCARVSRSIIRGVEKTGRLARGTRQRRRVERLGWERFSAVKRLLRNLFWEVPQCTSARSSAHVRPRTRLEGKSRDARTMWRPRRSPSAYPRTGCWARGAFSARPSRASAGFPRSRPAAPPFPFPGGPPSRTRGSRSGARAVSVTHARAPPITHAVLPSALPRAPSPFERRPAQLGISRIILIGHRPRGSRTPARPRRGFRALKRAGFPQQPARGGALAFLRANIPAAIGFVAPHSLLPPPQMYRLCRGVAAAAERRRAGTFSSNARPVSRFRANALRAPGAGRLLYNLVSAATLHFLLLRFTPLTTPIVATLPFPRTRAHGAECDVFARRARRRARRSGGRRLARRWSVSESAARGSRRRRPGAWTPSRGWASARGGAGNTFWANVFCSRGTATQRNVPDTRTRSAPRASFCSRASPSSRKR